MIGVVLILGLGAAAAVVIVGALRDFFQRVALVVKPFVWWFFGASMDGLRRTDATWNHRSTRDFHPSAREWHRRPGRQRAAHRTGGTFLALLTMYGLVTATTVTVKSLCLVTAAFVTLGVWRTVRWARTWEHRRHRVRPLEGSLMHGIPARPTLLEIGTSRDEASGHIAITGVRIEWPHDTEIKEPEKQWALESVTTRLALEAPDPAWKLEGRVRTVTFTPSEPPPSHVTWEDIAGAVERAAFNELVFGLGKKNAIVTAKYSQSPHLCIPGGSGGGKSNLAAFLLLQEMMRGTLIVNLDPKWTSHLWMQGLPNVINAHDIPDLHLALIWLGRELKRRTRAAYYSAGGTGRVRSKPGARVVVVCEELNYGMPDLKDYHQELRSENKQLPKKSQAVSALQGLSVAGRASDMHEMLIAQLLTVESTGVKDSTIRTNAGIKAMARHDRPGWDMAVGKHVPMPPQNTTPGRIHLVTGEGVRETQVPYLHLDDEDHPEVQEKAVRWARELAVSGIVAQIPAGPEGVPPQLWPPSVVRRPQLALTAGQGRETPATVAGARTVMTLREAVEKGVFSDRELGAVRRAVQRARLRETGVRDGGEGKEYLLSDLHKLARGAANDGE